MANPRDKVRFVNAKVKRMTFWYDSTIVFDKTKPYGSAQAGLAVTGTGEADSTVSLVGAGEHVTGRLELVEGDGKCTVTTQGVVELPAGTAAALTHGAPIIGALLVAAEGYIKAATTEVTARGEILDAVDTTKVQVDLSS